MAILALCIFWLWPSLVFSQATLERGLIAHYKFDTGDATDSSGNGNHGRIVGKPKAVAGPRGVALSFDGVQDYVDTQKTLLNRLPEFTISAFIRSRMLGARIGIAGQNDVVEVMLFDSTCHVWTQYGATWQNLGPANKWFHVAAVGKADRLMLYVNGEIKQSVAISRGATFGESQSTAKIGAGVADASGGYLDGAVDDVRFYSRALEPAEIVELSARDGSEVNTVLTFTSPRAGAIYVDGVYSGRTSADTVTVKGIGAHLIGLAVSGVGYQQQNIYLTGAPRKVVFGEHSWFLPRKWKNLLLGVRNMQLEGGVVAHLSDADLAGARESVRLANERWVLPFSYGLAEWVMEERVMEAPLGQLGVDQIDGDRFLSEAGLTSLREQYDGIFFFWPVVPDGATTFPCCGAVGGGCCISVPNNWGRVFGWEKPEIWVHEWLHIAEGHFQSQGYYTGIGGLHGAEGHGYRADNSGSWATWYRDFMAGQVREESNFVGIPPQAWVGSSRLNREANGATCEPSLAPASAVWPSDPGTGHALVSVRNPACGWAPTSDVPWITFPDNSQQGSGSVTYRLSANPGGVRTGRVYVGSSVHLVTQAPAGCSYSFSVGRTSHSVAGGSGTISLLTQSGCPWFAGSDVPWLSIESTSSGTGAAVLQYNVAANPSLYPRGAAVEIAGQRFSVAQDGSSGGPLLFVPIRPCRVADTRSGQGFIGPFGPPSLASGSAREIPVPQGTCGVPLSARAYSVNVTVVPVQRLSYLTVWPSSLAMPLVSLLNSFEGSVVANAAIVPAGSNGSISVFATDATDVIVDVNGYFAGSDSQALEFYTAEPCRVVDTRAEYASPGVIGPPPLAGGIPRVLPIRQGPCSVTPSAKAYSMNVTAVPSASLPYLTLWPNGQPRPLVSTLNSFEGRIVANAAILPAGVNGEISAFAAGSTNLILDLNGYFAASGGLSALRFYPIRPCRAIDTRLGQGTNGALGPPSMAGGVTREFPIPVGRCDVPASARAVATNVTVVPRGGLPFLTLWPSGQPRPTVSTLNSFDGRIVANMAILPVRADGAVSVFAASATDVIMDISGYFAP